MSSSTGRRLRAFCRSQTPPNRADPCRTEADLKGPARRADPDRVQHHGWLSAGERFEAVESLRQRVAVSDLRAVVNRLEGNGTTRRRPVEWIVAETESRRRLCTKLADEDLAKYLIDRSGIDLLIFAPLREALALSASDRELKHLHDYAGTSIRGGRMRTGKAAAIADRRWAPGKSWPHHFVEVLGLPLVFAGLPGRQQEPETEQVTPFLPLKPLEDFQKELMHNIVATLDGVAGANRGILTLPTGAGKTRTAVESLVRWRLGSGARAGILWVAQSEELCEQAVQAFREVWFDLGRRSKKVRDTLQIARLWGDRSIPADPDVVVASIQKLYAISRGTDASVRRQELVALKEQFGAVVIDEAHRMTAPSYTRVLRFLGIQVTRQRSSELPLLGLTATPFRRIDQETRQLAKSFHSQLLTPSSLGPDMVTELRRRQVLSEPDHRVVDWRGPKFSMDSNPQYREHFKQFQDFHPRFLQEIGESRERNQELLKRLLDLPEDWPTLFFGCTVEHAVAMAVLLRRQGRNAASITGTTRGSTRRALIEDFRHGGLSVLCNYGVLTTGFDAPRVRAVVIARPTTSPVLYEQMIGRGMRGPRFGGTDVCRVIDIADNIEFRGTLAYTRYRGYWNSNRTLYRRQTAVPQLRPSSVPDRARRLAG